MIAAPQARGEFGGSVYAAVQIRVQGFDFSYRLHLISKAQVKNLSLGPVLQGNLLLRLGDLSGREAAVALSASALM